MAQRILDTNRLIAQWQKVAPPDGSAARQAARDLIQLRGTAAIVTPIAIEFLGGARSNGELTLYREFLAEFRVADAGRILPADYLIARQLAERIPRPFRPRHFADCLIKAIADRLHYEVDTEDSGMPRSLPGKKKNQGRRSRRTGS